MRANLRSLLRAAIFSGAIFAFAGAANAHEIKISFLHFSDMAEIGPKDGLGGFAQLSALLKRERAKSLHSIVTFGGGLLGPSALSSATKGEQMIELANAAEVNFAVVGAADFAHGADVLKQGIADSKFTWLASNVVGADGKPALGLKQTATRIVEDEMEIMVGFIGLIAPDAALAAAAGPGVKFLPPIDAARAAVASLKEQGAHMIVALTAQPADADRALIAAVPEIDMVLGGGDKERITERIEKINLVKTRPNGEDIVRIDSFINAHGQLRTLRNSVNRYDTKGVEADTDIAPLVEKWSAKAPK